MAVDIQTIQTNIKQYTKDMTQYSWWMGGLNTKSKALALYSPLKTGYARIFFIKMPVFMETVAPNKTKNIRHLMEYGFTRIDGIQNLSAEFEQATGGYVGKAFDVMSRTTDETNEITLSLYELGGSPVREFTDLWVTGVSDPLSGLTHYHGAMDKDPTIELVQSNHTAEAIYVQTDPTGREGGIEYACLLTNLMPKQVKKEQFNYASGEHQLVQVDIPFTCVKYESIQINAMAAALIAKYKILSNYLQFNSGYTQADIDNLTVPNIADWNIGA